MKRVIPIVREIQCTNTNEDQAYMNIPIGSITAAKHTRYKRASGPLVGKCRLVRIQGLILFDYYTCWKKNATGIMILDKSL
jgi:hypothetical protein